MTFILNDVEKFPQDTDALSPFERKCKFTMPENGKLPTNKAAC